MENQFVFNTDFIIEAIMEMTDADYKDIRDKYEIASDINEIAVTAMISSYALLKNLKYDEAELLMSRFPVPEHEEATPFYETYTSKDTSKEKYQFLYLIQQKGTNLYKIGVTSNLNNRIQQLKIGNPDEIEFVAHRKIRDPYKAERFLHLYFREKLVRGEWFELSKKDIQTLINNFKFELEIK